LLNAPDGKGTKRPITAHEVTPSLRRLREPKYLPKIFEPFERLRRHLLPKRNAMDMTANERATRQQRVARRPSTIVLSILLPFIEIERERFPVFHDFPDSIMSALHPTRARGMSEKLADLNASLSLGQWIGFPFLPSPRTKSALGHEQTSRHVRVMSVILLKADIRQRGSHVRFVP
jgi:hypothetical protein